MTPMASSCIRRAATTVATAAMILAISAVPSFAADDQSSPPGSPAQPAPAVFHASGDRPQLAVTIIESASGGHDMDMIWSGVASSMGHTPTIVPQTTLDNTSFFATTDILIVSSGVIDLPANRVATIQQFIEQGGPVYLQSEYLCTYTTNAGFATIVANLGGSHSWIDTVSGDLNPMNVLGIFATTPNTVPPLSYFWYGCRGTGGATDLPFLEYGGDYFGFAFKPSDPGYGVIITTTDQDWVRASTSLDLMENILVALETGTVPVELQKVGVE